MDRHNLKYITSFLLLILFVTGCSDELDISGCPYPDSCNYNLDGTDEDSCWYPDGDCLCEDGEDAISDCTGECGGSATEDCLGMCNGEAIFDECGICNGLGEVLNEDDYIQIVVDWYSQFDSDSQISDEAYIYYSDNCINDYDGADIPEPPTFGTNWVKVYFNYPDWETPFGNNFTEVCNSLCETKEFNFYIQSYTQGSLGIIIDINNYFIFDFFGEILNGEIEIYEDNEIVDFYFDIDNVININSTIQANETKEFLIKLTFD